MPRTVWRLELEYTAGVVSQKEHLHYVVDPPEKFHGVFDELETRLSLWFTLEGPVGPNRQTMLPSEAHFTAIRAIAYIGILEPDAAPFAEFAIGLLGTNDQPPAPAVVSKELELRSRYGGRGRYGRIHLGSLSILDVDRVDSTIMPHDRMELYEVIYTQLLAILEVPYANGALVRVVNKHRRPMVPSDDVDGWFDYVISLGMEDNKLGTMQGRKGGG